MAYAVFYPNNRGGQQEAGINIKQHYDPSLMVVEPIADAPGLEIFDRRSQSWISVEAACVAGKEVIVFGGQALEVCYIMVLQLPLPLPPMMIMMPALFCPLP